MKLRQAALGFLRCSEHSVHCITQNPGLALTLIKHAYSEMWTFNVTMIISQTSNSVTHLTLTNRFKNVVWTEQADVCFLFHGQMVFCST